MKHWQSDFPPLETIGPRWIRACKRPGNPLILTDTLGTRLKARQALAGSILLSRRITSFSHDRHVGLLLPTSAAGMLCNLACMLQGRAAVNLNYTTSLDALQSSIRQAGITTIFTSKRFLLRLQERGMNLRALEDSARLVMLEDLRAGISSAERLWVFAQCQLLSAERLIQRFCAPQRAEDTAAILFSSGSEGPPKGVMLSHYNLVANVEQVVDLLDFRREDVLLANLPLFHAFGLTATLFLPLLNRVPVLCHPDPTDAPTIAAAIEQHRITVMFGTSTFFRLYIRNSKVRSQQLASLRLVVAGAEKLQPDVREAFMEKFGKFIYEGYGATETAPVASVNIPEELARNIGRQPPTNRVGSVGQPIPATRIRIVDPDTLHDLPAGEAGLVLISGPQVMKGYLDSAERSREVLHLHNERHWYATGDKGYLDEDGFLFIQDRYSRFAKISGEMISLGGLESAIREVLADDQRIDPEQFDLLAVNLPDERKGEKIVLLSTQPLSLEDLRTRLRAAGFNTLALPVSCHSVDTVPVLGSGKRDFAGARELATALTTADGQAAE